MYLFGNHFDEYGQPYKPWCSQRFYEVYSPQRNSENFFVKISFVNLFSPTLGGIELRTSKLGVNDLQDFFQFFFSKLPAKIIREWKALFLNSQPLYDTSVSIFGRCCQ